MSEIRKIAEDIAYDLIGSCDNLYVKLENISKEHLELNDEFCAVLDSIAFCCEKCNWWFEISEMTDQVDEWICEVCAGE